VLLSHDFRHVSNINVVLLSHDFRHVSNINVVLLSHDCCFALRFLCTVICCFSIIFAHLFEKHLVTVFALSAVDPRSNQTKNNKIRICCFSTKHPPLWRKIKKNCWIGTRWRDISTSGLLIQWADVIKIQLNVLPSTKRTSSSSYRMCLLLAMIWLKNYSFCIKQQSLTHSLTRKIFITWFSVPP
jgi:hypothetical protein